MPRRARFARVRRLVRRLITRLPPPRDDAALRLLRAGRDLVTGRAAPRPKAPRAPRPKAKLPTPPPLGDTSRWQLPPRSDGHDVFTEVLYDTGAAAPRYDVDLLERLNKEWADKPLVPSPPSFEVEDRVAVARQRIGWVQNYVDLPGKTVLELGCSNGYEAWLLAHNLGCDAYGIDVNARGAWKDLEGERVHFTCADMAIDNPYPHDMFDVIYSFVVWEHVVHPRAMLQAAYDVLKPGGVMWLRANLFCGPQASHRYRDIYFPWPHLLFSEDVIRDWDEKHGREREGPAWVNRLTWDNYERHINEVGFLLHQVNFQQWWDQEFYERFEDMLGRYPRRDLKRDFFLAVMQKPG